MKSKAIFKFPFASALRSGWVRFPSDLSVVHVTNEHYVQLQFLHMSFGIRLLGNKISWAPACGALITLAQPSIMLKASQDLDLKPGLDLPISSSFQESRISRILVRQKQKVFSPSSHLLISSIWSTSVRGPPFTNSHSSSSSSSSTSALYSRDGRKPTSGQRDRHVLIQLANPYVLENECVLGLKGMDHPSLTRKLPMHANKLQRVRVPRLCISAGSAAWAMAGYLHTQPGSMRSDAMLLQVVIRLFQDTWKWVLSQESGNSLL